MRRRGSGSDDESESDRDSRSGDSRGKKKRSLKRTQSKMALQLTKMVPWLLKAEEIMTKVIRQLYPLMVKAKAGYKKLYKQLKPYGPEQIIMMSTGVSMMFFGGFFITTVAVIEAMDQGGRESLVKNIKRLHEQADNIREANREDDLRDDDGDGIADVEQISEAELSVRKLMVFIRACDPEVVADSLGNLYGIFMAVTATLQVKFARAISLGAAIGNVISKTTMKFIVPPLKEVLPEDFHKWLPPVVRYICRFIGVSIAFSVNRVLSTVHTSIRGARLATDGFTQWCEARDLHYLSDGYLDDAFAFFLAGLGVYGQLFVWSRLPLLVKLIMFPFTLTEWILTMLVSLQVSRGTSTESQAANFGRAGDVKGGADLGSLAAGLAGGKLKV